MHIHPCAGDSAKIYKKTAPRDPTRSAVIRHLARLFQMSHSVIFDRKRTNRKYRSDGQTLNRKMASEAPFLLGLSAVWVIP